MSDTPTNNQQDDVRILPPDFSLKKKIGVDVNLKDIFTTERIAAAQQAIDNTQVEFVEWAKQDLLASEKAYKEIEDAPDNAPQESINTLRKLAFSLKSQSGTFGYPLGSEVANSLYVYTGYHTEYDEQNIQVLAKHIDALSVILHQNVQGDGGAIGTDLRAELAKLAEKFD